MARLNINLAPEFQDNLQKLMRLRDIASKSEAVCLAVKEAQKAQNGLAALIGWANQLPENPNPRFKSHDELWKKDK